MKTLQLLFCAIALLLSSCSTSNEEKAEKLVENTLKSILYYPNSYESRSTRVDSSFIDPTTIKPILQLRKEITDLQYKIVFYEDLIKKAETSMNIYAPEEYSSQFSLGQYGQHKKEKEKNERNLEKYREKLHKKYTSFKENITKYYKGEFSGWAIYHYYKSLDGNGETPMFDEMIFFCDKNFTTCNIYLSSYEIKQFFEILKGVQESTTDDELLDYLYSFPTDYSYAEDIYM